MPVGTLEQSLSTGLMQKCEKFKCEVSAARWCRGGQGGSGCLVVWGRNAKEMGVLLSQLILRLCNSLSFSLALSPSLS